MLDDILNPESMDRSIDRRNHESLGRPEDIYTHFLITAYDIILTTPSVDGKPAMQASALTASKAATDVGGIDMNSNLLDLIIKRDSQGMPLPASQQNWARVHINGLEPVIIKIEPVNLAELIGSR